MFEYVLEMRNSPLVFVFFFALFFQNTCAQQQYVLSSSPHWTYNKKKARGQFGFLKPFNNNNKNATFITEGTSSVTKIKFQRL